METAIKPKKRLEEGEERRFAPHCILAKESDPWQLLPEPLFQWKQHRINR
jgi:hypothetical protein